MSVRSLDVRAAADDVANATAWPTRRVARLTTLGILYARRGRSRQPYALPAILGVGPPWDLHLKP